MNKVKAAFEVERLLLFALNHNIIEELDVITCRNALLDLLKIEEPYEGEVQYENLESAVEILNNILDYAAENKLIEDNTITYRDLFDTKIMGLLMPRESEVVKNFYNTYKEEGPQKATDEFYALSKASNYIRMDRIEKNLYWKAATEYGDLEITINLSKPEKDPKEIAASKLRPQSNYPKCLLCLENIGYAGHLNHPARQNHRVIPVNITGEQWYLQYSPYVYYNEHCILFNANHVPMKISYKTFERLLNFLEQFPHYFMGSNADLPIVGGSILSHDHFQGGRHVFPMEIAPIETYFKSDNFSKVKAGIVKWPMSVIRISSKDKEELLYVSNKILDSWKKYSDETLDILAYSNVNGEIISHNTITPIARINKENEYEFDLVLRNNRTSKEHPDGIFHPHKELHHIKKENIGLIEVMGLAVLPGRLSVELKEIGDILKGDTVRFKKAQENIDDAIYKHLDWIKELLNKYGTNLNSEKVNDILKAEVGNKFLKVLKDAGVYKRDENGQKGFIKFMESIGFKNK
ncbi:UTP-hexose-1-phosphate uridylyltransferase [Clostridium sp. USBA 49]|uniref:UDP-glucose--hexose-1-phosphate uridylyltransferase n=1 Tax=Clostridium sp. USBA 49 TaxID=1881060 RepID=UPI00099B17E7|nr:UDP-glucose--hexose-1-phosphate uridylyltransferase [Clostridium sp. USBA 49]SKA73840.1 UTP-hexose-1-phosphate uridylyltransferase [Clostridium sp. USBA 49]